MAKEPEEEQTNEGDGSRAAGDQTEYKNNAEHESHS